MLTNISETPKVCYDKCQERENSCDMYLHPVAFKGIKQNPEILQQQGIELTDEAGNIIPELIEKIKNLAAVLQEEELEKEEVLLAD